jgi:hypothetical protein
VVSAGNGRESFQRSRGKRMRLTPRRVLVHIIIVLFILALPLLLPSSCGPVVHSAVVLAAGISN